MFTSVFRSSLLHVSCLLGFILLRLEAQAQSDLVLVKAGDLPIILTSPHGGSDSIPGVAVRQGKGVNMFKSMSDAFTIQLTEKIADALEVRTGKRPYVVIARFHRKYLDANRRPRDAYESPEAEAVYNEYHKAIADARSQVINRWGRGVLFDIHGQAEESKTIYRGTQNGKTTTHLNSRFGSEALIGETSMFGLLSKQGLQVIPSVGSTESEHPSFNGGYTVITHGSSSGGTVDAIQLELGQELRALAGNVETANKVANAIQEFSSKYLPQEEQPRQTEPATEKNSSGTIAVDIRDVRVGVYVDEGAGQSVNGLLSVLSKFDRVSITKLKADDIRSGKLEGLDLLIQPGGSGGGQGRHLGEDGRDVVRRFVEDGGGFVGICAGAYLASSDYTWSLNILDAKVIDRKHWNRGKGTVDIALTDAGLKLLETKSNKLAIHYSQGPLLAPGNRPEIEDYEVIATFETEIADKGAPKGVMKGTTAIAKGNFGNGRVICFSPHPEMTDGLEQLVRIAIDHVKRQKSE